MVKSPTVLVVGAASRDVVGDDPRGWRPGGAVLYASLALARLGIEVRAVVGVDREAAGAEELALLREAGIALAIAPLDSGPVFDNVEHRYLAGCDRIPLAALPRRWTSGFDALLLAPVADEIADEWATLARPASGRFGEGAAPADLRALPSHADSLGPVVALGWQGLLRILEPGDVIRPRRPVASPIMGAADLVVVSEADVAAGTTPHDLHRLLRPEATLVWTEGARGGLVVEPAQTAAGVHPGPPLVRRYQAIESDAVVDVTGAGDVFLASMLAALLQPSLGEPLIVAAAAASLTVEGPGLAGVPDLAAVRRRMTRAPSLASRRPSEVSSRDNGRPSQA